MPDYQIVKSDPTNWKMLQDCISSILKDCGFDTANEKVIETVRGRVEVDVFAQKKNAYTSTVLCECKYWNSSVPQTIIHAFRTIVEDSDASQGIIISRAGFQKGAYEAVSKANVSLLTWKEFQDAFMMDYLQNVIDRNYKKGHELRTKATRVLEIHHINPFVLSDGEFNAFQLQRETSNHLLFYSFREHYEHLDTRQITIDEVERGIKTALRDLKIEVSALKDFFDFIYLKCQDEVDKIDLLLTLIENRLTQKV